MKLPFVAGGAEFLPNVKMAEYLDLLTQSPENVGAMHTAQLAFLETVLKRTDQRVTREMILAELSPKEFLSTYREILAEASPYPSVPQPAAEP